LLWIYKIIENALGSSILVLQDIQRKQQLKKTVNVD